MTPDEERQVNEVVEALLGIIVRLADGKDDDELVFTGALMADIGRQCGHADLTDDDFPAIPAGEIRRRYRRALASLARK